MTPQELKNSILQLAIQGKLVEQRPEEGMAEELYRQIQQEKQRLIKEGKIKKVKPLPGITEEEKPFDIPESWKWVRLKDICTKIVDGDHNPPAGISHVTDYWMLSAQNINNNSLSNLDQIRYLARDVFDIENERTRAQSGDLFFTIVGTLGRSCVYEGGYNICFQRSVSVISTLIYNYYLKYTLDSGYIQHFMVVNATGTAQKGFYLNQVEKLCIPLPPLAEQKRIAAKIEELLLLIDRYEKAWNRLEEFNTRFPDDMQQSILQMAIQGKLVEQRPEEGTGEELYLQILTEKQKLVREGKIKKEKSLPEITEDEKPFDIPESWKWVRFETLCSVLTCGYASTPTYVSKDEGMPFISAKNVKPYKFMPEDHQYISKDLYQKLTQNAKPERGDILLTRVGAGIGEAAIIDSDLHFAIYVSLTLIKLVSLTLVDNQYILFWLNSPIGVSSAKKNIFGKNASQGNLNVKNVRDFLVPLPPFDEQKRIVARIEELLPLVQSLNIA